MFGLIFGFFFWNALGYFVIEGMEMQMRGQTFPMNINEQIIRPLLSNASVVGLFFIPMITMRLFAEEKRSGTIELLATSPVRDIEVILGKWLAAMMLYCLPAALYRAQFCFSLPLRASPIGSRWPSATWVCLLQAGTLLALGTFISTLTKNQIIAGAATFGVCLLLWVLEWTSGYESATWAQVLCLSLRHYSLRILRQRSDSMSKDVIFYLSGIFLGLFFTARSMESLRWRS